MLSSKLNSIIGKEFGKGVIIQKVDLPFNPLSWSYSKNANRDTMNSIDYPVRLCTVYIIFCSIFIGT